MSKTILIAVLGVVVGVGVAAGLFMYFVGFKHSNEVAAEPTPVATGGKLGPHITLQDRIFNLQSGTGTQTYLKLQTVIEFETTSKDWAKVLRGCVVAPRAPRIDSAPLVSAMPQRALGEASDFEGAAADPCETAEAKLQADFVREIGTGQQLVEDAVLSVVTRHTAAEISTPDGKEALKNEIKQAVGKLIHEPKVTRVLFTNFITQ